MLILQMWYVPDIRVVQMSVRSSTFLVEDTANRQQSPSTLARESSMRGIADLGRTVRCWILQRYQMSSQWYVTRLISFMLKGSSDTAFSFRDAAHA